MSYSVADRFDPETGLILFGGRFDPWHEGHRQMVFWLRDNLRGTVLIAPAAAPAHKPILSGLSFAARCQRISADIGTQKRIRLSRLEEETDCCGRTGRLIPHINHRYHPARIAIAIGADEWNDLPQWENIESWMNSVDWIIVQRHQTSLSLPANPLLTTAQPVSLPHSAGTLNFYQEFFVFLANNPLAHFSGSELRVKQTGVLHSSL